MADFVGPFWSIYVGVITAVSIAFCLFLLLANSRKPPQTADNTTGHVWDEDIREANNPLPLWWMGLFLITIVFSAIYLVWYPGMGAFAGAGGWSSLGQYEGERRALEERQAPIFAAFDGKPATALVADPSAMAIGERLFMNNCAQCHGSDARGAKGFPDLTDDDWLYGGSGEAIAETIAKGRHGAMPPMTAVVGAANVESLAHFVRSLSGLAHDPVRREVGRSAFAACAACHGADGKGMQALGAPNLTDRTWLHGSSLPDIVATIAQGRDNRMPSHGDKLSPGQIHVLSAYVLSLAKAR
jgi:cytochrome c oxidase cbb3-type subunit 3